MSITALQSITTTDGLACSMSESHLLGDALGVGEEEPSFRTQDQQPGPGLVVGCSLESGRNTCVPRLRPTA